MKNVILNVRQSSTKEKFAKCEAELNSTRAQLREAETYIGTDQKHNLRAAELQGEADGLRSALNEANDQINNLNIANRAPKHIAERYGITLIKLALDVRDTPKYKDVYNGG
ncbi:hypothetical protein SARC_00642 [Sphaeroforma arctica JP610]|uniref:Uncharacterized protein n=1 Tax=Sphaeroforma arctica JP610 TaxID=667725 RepID=A0A0L0GEE0_9EUKA|nr:hypothetical protein SARC_00642 [Sphaeroforma arctica JP610]KNC87256.1 hypothetical protein SARC_00642 [Sphaeroforma arctica JP610]|eukprot:XP_014161158.1 hypothetical protein SARC_00642 [Sphaeroforma arctica JP610]